MKNYANSNYQPEVEANNSPWYTNGYIWTGIILIGVGLITWGYWDNITQFLNDVDKSRKPGSGGSDGSTNEGGASTTGGSSSSTSSISKQTTDGSTETQNSNSQRRRLRLRSEGSSNVSRNSSNADSISINNNISNTNRDSTGGSIQLTDNRSVGSQVPIGFPGYQIDPDKTPKPSSKPLTLIDSIREMKGQGINTLSHSEMSILKNNSTLTTVGGNISSSSNVTNTNPNSTVIQAKHTNIPDVNEVIISNNHSIVKGKESTS